MGGRAPRDTMWTDYQPGAAERKRAQLEADAARHHRSSAALSEFHERLCFLRAFPDDRATLALVERELTAFERRADLKRHRAALADSGIAGTAIHFAFYWATAQWLVRRWPDSLTVEWAEFERAGRLDRILHLLASPAETPAIDEFDFSAREWIGRLKGPAETDAAFLVRAFRGIGTDDFWKERLFEDLELPFRLSPGAGTPSRTHARLKGLPVSYQRGPLRTGRPELREQIDRPPRAVRALTPARGREVIELTRAAMATRSRDLDVFANADERDVRLVDCGDGLVFACIGVRPERRLLLEAVYGFLTLKNGVPIGYVLTSALFGSSEIAFNVFDGYRGAESGWIYGRVLAMTRQLFGSDSFVIDPYQLGHHNDEGLASGAWWFYYKFGFRPRAPGVQRIAAQETRRMQLDPRHRSSRATLRKLVAEPLYWHRGAPRDDILGSISLGNIALAATRYLAGRFGGARERGNRVCAAEAASRLGVRSRRGFSTGERDAWTRWAPLVLVLPGVERWSAAERRELVRVIRAKGGRRESEFVRRFDAHRRLRDAIRVLGAAKP